MMTDFRDSQKNQVRSANQSERNKVYQSLQGQIRLFKAKLATRDFAVAISRNGVFLPDDLTNAFEAVWKELHSTLISFEVGKQCNNDGLLRKASENSKELDHLYNELKASVRNRLRAHALGNSIR